MAGVEGGSSLPVSLVDYTATFWYVHQRYMEMHVPQSYSDALAFLLSEQAHLDWFRLSYHIILGFPSSYHEIPPRPLDTASTCRLPASVRKLCEEIEDINAYGGLRSLCHAITAGAADIVGALLQKGVTPRGDDLWNCVVSSRNGPKSVRMARMLLEAGAEVNPSDSQSPLLIAARCGRKELMQLVVSRGAILPASIETCDALCDSARFGDVDTMELLLSHGANVNAECANQCSPLQRASGLRAGTSKALLLHAADPNHRSARFGTALHEVKASAVYWKEDEEYENDGRDIIDLLSSYGAVDLPPLGPETLHRTISS